MTEKSQWRDYVEGFARLYYGELTKLHPDCRGERIMPPAESPLNRPGTVLLCSPHPDDEALVGALPLRLQREGGARVVNLVMTAGSNPARRKERLAEARDACALLGFACQPAFAPLGFSGLTATTRGRDPKGWLAMRKDMLGLLAHHQPDLVLFPHAGDLHPTHRGVHDLVLSALLNYSMERDSPVITVQSEYWQPMMRPNLLVELGSGDLAALVGAVACHVGEVVRNPYHLRLPGRMMDTVRRVGELLAGTGRPAPPFAFGEGYRLGAVRQGYHFFAEPLLIPQGERLTIDFLLTRLQPPT